MRTATIKRSTSETSIEVSVNLDGTGVYDVATGVGFFDHMLEQLSRHSLIDLTVRTQGDHPEKRNGSCSTTPIWRRSERWVMLRTSTPSMQIGRAHV